MSSYKWYWMSDSGWLAFDAKKSQDLEKGYTNKVKSVTLDKVCVKIKLGGGLEGERERGRERRWIWRSEC